MNTIQSSVKNFYGNYSSNIPNFLSNLSKKDTKIALISLGAFLAISGVCYLAAKKTNLFAKSENTEDTKIADAWAKRQPNAQQSKKLQLPQ